MRALDDIYIRSRTPPRRRLVPTAHPHSLPAPRARNNIRRAQETPRHRSASAPQSPLPTPHVVGAPQQLLRWLASSSSCARSATARPRPAPARDRTACGQSTEFTSPCLLLSSGATWALDQNILKPSLSWPRPPTEPDPERPTWPSVNLFFFLLGLR
jgi:hypothetical protein